MEWYVLLHDFNKDKIIFYNIFNNSKLDKELKELKENYISKENFVSELDRILRWCFWSKSEYEIVVGDLFEKDLDKYEKIDVYQQLKPNLNTLADYIIYQWTFNK